MDRNDFSKKIEIATENFDFDSVEISVLETSGYQGMGARYPGNVCRGEKEGGWSHSL